MSKPVRVTGGKYSLDLPSWLAYLYQPILPALKKIKIRRQGKTYPNPDDIILPPGFRAEVVATGLQAPVHACFDRHGNCYVCESGHKTDAPPRILRIDVNTGRKEVVYTVPEARWIHSGALTGACWHEGFLYFTNTDTLSRLGPDGTVEDLVTGLPGRGDHQTNHPLVGPDGKIYFGQGCVTNAGVVGADDYAFEWLPRFPDVCDVPAQAITLTGENFETRDVLDGVQHTACTGAYVPYDTATTRGQVIPGSDKPSGAIMRCNRDGSHLEVVAWGLRNPYGIAFHPDGRLFATEHGMDERGRRFIVDDPDDFYEIKEGEWYGWPDFASGVRLDDPFWGEGGQNRQPLLETHPNPNPPPPVAMFTSHEAANGFDFSRSSQFGFEGQAFVACFGDLKPITTLRRAIYPNGFKVVRLDPATGETADFAVNKIEGPASKLPHEGFERPSHCVFGPDGALYVVDYGIIRIAPEVGGIRMQMDSGVLWRIRPDGSRRGERLAKRPIQAPLYALQAVAILVGAAALLGLAAKAVSMWRKKG